MRQGSIMAPKLFAIDVDDLTQSLIKIKIGCMLDEVCFNHNFMRTIFVYWHLVQLPCRTYLTFAMNTVSNTMSFTIH